MTVHCTSVKKDYEKEHHFQYPNLILNQLKFKNSRYVYPLLEMLIRDQFANFIFNFWCHVTIFKKTSRYTFREKFILF